VDEKKNTYSILEKVLEVLLSSINVLLVTLKDPGDITFLLTALVLYYFQVKVFAAFSRINTSSRAVQNTSLLVGFWLRFALVINNDVEFVAKLAVSSAIASNEGDMMLPWDKHLMCSTNLAL
jgi:putative Ca2+/H+ antiporter (TMEM165/GDT1 family)